MEQRVLLSSPSPATTMAAPPSSEQQLRKTEEELHTLKQLITDYMDKTSHEKWMVLWRLFRGDIEPAPEKVAPAYAFLLLKSLDNRIILTPADYFRASSELPPPVKGAKVKLPSRAAMPPVDRLLGILPNEYRFTKYADPFGHPIDHLGGLLEFMGHRFYTPTEYGKPDGVPIDSMGYPLDTNIFLPNESSPEYQRHKEGKETRCPIEQGDVVELRNRMYGKLCAIIQNKPQAEYMLPPSLYFGLGADNWCAGITRPEEIAKAVQEHIAELIRNPSTKWCSMIGSPFGDHAESYTFDPVKHVRIFADGKRTDVYGNLLSPFGGFMHVGPYCFKDATDHPIDSLGNPLVGIRSTAKPIVPGRQPDFWNTVVEALPKATEQMSLLSLPQRLRVAPEPTIVTNDRYTLSAKRSEALRNLEAKEHTYEEVLKMRQVAFKAAFCEADEDDDDDDDKDDDDEDDEDDDAPSCGKGSSSCPPPSAKGTTGKKEDVKKEDKKKKTKQEQSKKKKQEKEEEDKEDEKQVKQAAKKADTATTHPKSKVGAALEVLMSKVMKSRKTSFR